MQLDYNLPNQGQRSNCSTVIEKAGTSQVNVEEFAAVMLAGNNTGTGTTDVWLFR